MEADSALLGSPRVIECGRRRMTSFGGILTTCDIVSNVEMTLAFNNRMNNMKKFLTLMFLLLPGNLFARGVQKFVTTSYSAGDVKRVWEDLIADIYVSQAESSAVRNAATLFTEDVERVTERKPSLSNSLTGFSSHAVIVGTLGKSQMIKDLIAARKIDVSEVQGKWETFLIQVVSNGTGNIRGNPGIMLSTKPTFTNTGKTASRPTGCLRLYTPAGCWSPTWDHRNRLPTRSNLRRDEGTFMTFMNENKIVFPKPFLL